MILYVALLVGNGLALAYLFFQVGRQRHQIDDLKQHCNLCTEEDIGRLARTIASYVASELRKH